MRSVAITAATMLATACSQAPERSRRPAPVLSTTGQESFCLSPAELWTYKARASNQDLTRVAMHYEMCAEDIESANRWLRILVDRGDEQAAYALSMQGRETKRQ